eukprot:476651-Rhodomonas_salina.1
MAEPMADLGEPGRRGEEEGDALPPPPPPPPAPAPVDSQAERNSNNSSQSSDHDDASSADGDGDVDGDGDGDGDGAYRGRKLKCMLDNMEDPVRVNKLKRSVDTMAGPLQADLHSVHNTIAQITQTKVELDFTASSLPALTQDCVKCLSRKPTLDWANVVPWTSKRDGQGSSETTVKQLRVSKDIQVHDGLSWLAERLGYVWTGKTAKPFSLNVNALLAGLGSGDAFKKSSVLGKTFGHAFAGNLKELDSK